MIAIIPHLLGYGENFGLVVSTPEDWGLIQNSLSWYRKGWKCTFKVNGEVYEGVGWGTSLSDIRCVESQRETHLCSEVIQSGGYKLLPR